MTYESEIAALSPKLFYKMDETSGTTCTDYGSLGINGTYTNSPTLNAGALYGAGSSVTFDGTDDHVVVSTSAPASWTAITMGGWIVPTTVNDKFGSIMTLGGSVPLAVGLGTVAGTASYWNAGMYNGSWNTVKSLQTVKAGLTYFVVGSITSSGLLKLYVNGLFAGSLSIGTWASWTANEIRFARRWDGTSYSAQKMSGWAIWDSQLTDAQIYTLYDAGKPLYVETEADIMGQIDNPTSTFYPYGEGPSGGGPATVPTEGQTWPRGNRGV